MNRTIVAVTLCLIATASNAQVQRSGNADARVAQQLQQLANEKIALQAENDKLKQELEQVKAQLQKSASTAKELENRNRALQVSSASRATSDRHAEEQLERSRAQMQELVTKFRETAQTLRDVEVDRATAKSQLAAKEREYKVCVDRNAGLYELNDEVLDRLEDRGFWSKLAEREPFTRLKRTQLENLIDDYRYRVDELRVEKQP
jgi:DNA repair exonuclease SbcCD ATPase subunit